MNFIQLSDLLRVGYFCSDVQVSDKAISGITGHSLTTMGKVKIQVCDKGKSFDVEFYVVKHGPNLLGLSTLRDCCMKFLFYGDESNVTLSTDILKLIASPYTECMPMPNPHGYGPQKPYGYPCGHAHMSFFLRPYEFNRLKNNMSHMFALL